MKLLIRKAVICTLLFPSLSHSSNWVSIRTANMASLSVDTASTQTYPGVVTVITREALEKSKNYFFKKVAFTCGSNELWGVAASMSSSKDISDGALTATPADMGLVKSLSSPTLIGMMKRSCQDRYSRLEVEIPVSQGGDIITFVLAKDSVFNGNRVSIWEKKYKFITEAYMSQGSPVVIDGQTITHDVIVSRNDYSLNNVEYDCSARTSRFLSLNQYSSKYSAPSSINTSDQSKPDPVIPGTTGSKILEFACSLK